MKSRAEIPWFMVEKRTRDAINRLLREAFSQVDVCAADVAAELRRRRPDIAAQWSDLDAAVEAHLRRRWGT
jgi:hypothetical protein